MSKKSRDNRDFWIFVGPALFAMVMVVIIPFIIGIYYTFTNWNGANPEYDFVGLSNYMGLIVGCTIYIFFKNNSCIHNCKCN